MLYWYNVIHELGHAVLCLLSGRIEGGPDEELLVNRFAVAFWSRCGEPEKLRAPAEVVGEILPCFCRPAPDGMDFLSYARAHWGTDALCNFNNYGWFQSAAFTAV